MSRDEGEEAPHEMLRRPSRESDATTRLYYTPNFGQRDFGAWREHVPELADDYVEALVGIRQVLGVSLNPFNWSAGGDPFIVSGVLKQRWRKIEARNPRSATGGGDRDNARSAADVEHLFSSCYGCKVDQMAGHRRRQRCGWREGRPCLTLSVFELYKRILGHGISS